MNELTSDLPEVIRRQADKILHEINSSGSMIAAVKTGAKANGFVLGVKCAEGLTAERCDLLAEQFDKLVESKLRLLALGIQS